MRKLLGFLFLVVGVAIFFHGYTMSESVLYDFLELTTGPASDPSVWYLISGTLTALLGLAFTTGGSRRAAPR